MDGGAGESEAPQGANMAKVSSMQQHSQGGGAGGGAGGEMYPLGSSVPGVIDWLQNTAGKTSLGETVQEFVDKISKESTLMKTMSFSLFTLNSFFEGATNIQALSVAQTLNFAQSGMIKMFDIEGKGFGIGGGKG